MLKKNKGKLIISSLLILMPVIAGLLLWKELPDRMTTHFGLDGVGDGYSTKLFAITVPFVFLLLVHWFCLFFTSKDSGNKGQNKKVTGMLFWIIPTISIFMGSMIYSFALGFEVNPVSFVMLLMGILFIIIGNYLPKCKQNSTIGIKLSWTLQNEENWNRTHRFGGKVWVAGGFMFLLSMLFPEKSAVVVLFTGIMLMVIVPVIYSYRYYRRQKREGRWSQSSAHYNEQA